MVESRKVGLRYANYESGSRGKVELEVPMDWSVLDLKTKALENWPKG